MGLTTRGETSHVFLVNTGLSDELINRLRNASAPSMQFHLSMGVGQSAQQFSNLEQAFTFWRTLASSNSEIPELNLEDYQTDQLVRYLERLTGTADYWNKASRPVLAQRVMATMPLFAVKETQNRALECIHSALTSCNDGIILAQDELDMMQSLIYAENLAFENRNPSELRALGLQKMRLDEVNRIAFAHINARIKALKWVDNVEVLLAFRIGVGQQLDMPGLTQHMLFRGCAQVSEKDIAEAVQLVNTRCSGAQFEDYLAQWEPWQKFQRPQAAPSFEQLESKTVTSIKNCQLTFTKTEKMVELAGIHLDYGAIVRTYWEKGMNPFTNTPLDWSSVVRLIEESPPSKRED